MGGRSPTGLCLLLSVVITCQHVSCSVTAGNCQASDGVVNLLVSEISPTWTLLEWEHSPLAATCADHYNVSWCVLPSRWSPECKESSEEVPLSTGSFNITDLQPCTINRVAVSTVGKDGVQAQVTDVIITPSEGLGAVRNLDVTVSGEQFALSWDAPAGDEACVTRYEVCWWRQANDKRCSWTQLNIWLGGDQVVLQDCGSYNFSVRAADVANTTSSEAVQSYQTGPERVENLTASEVTAHSFLLSWDSPASSSSCLAEHTITWCPVDSYSGECLEPATAVNVTGDDTQLNITGLRPCHQHRVSVASTSDDGSQSDAVAISVKTSLAGFGPPQNIRVAVMSSEITFVDFSPAEDSGLCTTNYTGCLQEDDDPESSPVCLPAPNDQYWTTWDDHTKPCTNYTLQLMAFGNGNSTASTSVSFISGAADASKLRVTNVISNSSKSSAKLTWEVAPLNNKCVQYQQVTWSAEDMNPSSSVNISSIVREFVFEDLEPCTQYEAGVKQLAASSSSEITILFKSGSNVTSARDLVAAGSTPDSVTISFVAPEASPACVANYSICYQRTEGNRSRKCGMIEATGQNSIHIGFLQACTNYTMDVAPVSPDNTTYRTSSVVATTTGCPNSAAVTLAVNTVASLFLLGTVWYSTTIQR